MYDIHTHLYWQSYDTDRDAVIERARVAGVEKMFVIGCTVEESAQCVALASQYEFISAAVGVHPQEFSVTGTSKLSVWIESLKTLAQEKKVVAIGECGLEYYSRDVHQSVTAEQRVAQREGFVAQLVLAEELQLPLIVHCRASTATPDDAYRDLLEILRTEGAKLPAIILHCYMGDTEVTRDLLALPNIFFSFTANITYPVKGSVRGTKHDLTETVKVVPMERMFTETDCPFLSPQSRRGERNEPTAVLEIIETIAALQGKPVAEVTSTLDANFERVFGDLTKDDKV